MSETDRVAWGREVNRLGKQIEHRRKTIAAAEAEVVALAAKRDELLGKIADDYNEEKS